MAKAKKSKGTVGIVGLGIMGGAFAKNLVKNGWRVVGIDLSAAARREAKPAGVEIVAKRRRCRGRRAGRADQPAQAAGTDGGRAQKSRRQVEAEGDRRDEHLHNFR